jgi:hypothetical protein
VAEITARAISDVLKAQLESYQTEIDVREVGTVMSVGDGIARVDGLRGAMAGELLEFVSGDGRIIFGMALNLDEHEVGAVLMGDPTAIKENDTVRTTGRTVEVPSGPGSSAGSSIRSESRSTARDRSPPRAMRPLEFRAPGVIERKPVHEPMQTGIMAIDAMIPIGRGQRELIIGDRQTGKTAVAIDTIINQKGTGVICVYVAIGQKASTVAGVVETLERYGAMDYTIVVSATASDPAPLQYIAPLAGCAMGEFFMYNGADGKPASKDNPAATCCASTTTSPSRPSHTARCRSRSAARRAARRTPATSSTCTAACSSARSSCPTTTVPVRSRPSRSSRRRRATSRPTSRPTSSPSPTVRSSCRPTCSSRACVRRSTSASRSRESVARRRSRR